MQLTARRARRSCSAYPWPGNVRELRNLVERLTILAAGRAVASAPTCRSDMPAAVAGVRRAALVGNSSSRTPSAALLEGALRGGGGHQGRAAAALGISRHALKRRMQRLGIG